ncbi:MAG TPA: PA2779 family protein [Lysobacter sp.]
MLRKLVIAPVLVVALVFSGYSSVVSAAVISTQEALSAEQRAATESSVRTSMARDDVRQAMLRMGVDPAQADARIASLSDSELLRVQGQFDKLPAGGDSGVLVVVGIVFVVLLILELTGVINIFNRV